MLAQPKSCSLNGHQWAAILTENHIIDCIACYVMLKVSEWMYAGRHSNQTLCPEETVITVLKILSANLVLENGAYYRLHTSQT